MAATQITKTSALTKLEQSVLLFSQVLKSAEMYRRFMGPAPKMSSAEKKLRHQTDPGYPIVGIKDLTTRGGRVTVDCVNVVTGQMIMGDADASQSGVPLEFSTMNIDIDQYTSVPVDINGKMMQHRTLHQLDKLAFAQVEGFMKRYETQSCLVHKAGARGSVNGPDWTIPLQTDPNFASIMVNPVKAPTYNRHFVVNNTSVLIQGGAQLGSIAAADTMKLGVMDAMAKYLDDLSFKLQPVQMEGDPRKDDEPFYIWMMPPNVYDHLITDATASNNIRHFQSLAYERTSDLAKDHPLFRGQIGMWRNFICVKTPWAIRFMPSDSTNIVTSANRYTATESAQTVNGSLTAGYAVERSIILGAQALGCAFGNAGNDFYFDWLEHGYNMQQSNGKWRNRKIAACAMGGKAKFRFDFPRADGSAGVEPTDFGALVVDCAVKLP